MRGVLGVIPARLRSERLPGKPLLVLAGRPLIEWVWRRAVACRLFDQVVIATDAREIARVAEGFGADVRMTAAGHPSGTDRVAEISRLPDFRPFELLVNLQGDEPFAEGRHLRPAVELVQSGGWEIGTLAAPITDERELADPAAVKVVRDDRGGAMLFSRAPIPVVREAREVGSFPGPVHLRHIGVYVYTAGALARWVARPEGRLERIERLEQLRPLAAGEPIGVAVVDSMERGVDTPEDVRRAEARLQAEIIEIQ